MNVYEVANQALAAANTQLEKGIDIESGKAEAALRSAVMAIEQLMAHCNCAHRALNQRDKESATLIEQRNYAIRQGGYRISERDNLAAELAQEREKIAEANDELTVLSSIVQPILSLDIDGRIRVLKYLRDRFFDE